MQTDSETKEKPAETVHPADEGSRLEIASWLLNARAKGTFNSIHFWIISASLVLLAYIYYGVLTSFHDVYAVLFFYPLLYAAIVYRLRGALVGWLVILSILLPYTMFVAFDPYSLARTALFALFAFLISILSATLLNFMEHQLEAYREIVALNRELTEYVERLEHTQRQLVQAGKLNAIGQLAASVAHEINNPLAGVLIYSKLMAKKLAGNSFDVKEGLDNPNKIEVAVGHCSHIIKSLLDFSRQSEPKFESANIKDIIDRVMTLVGHQAEMGKVGVNVGDMSSVPPIMADARQLQQVFINLLVNAIQAMPQGGELSIMVSADGGDWLKVSVQDSGTGIAPGDMERLFTPFFTTKEKDRGTGLGLAVSYGIVERHGGRIEVQSEVNQGSTFTVYFPFRH